MTADRERGAAETQAPAETIAKERCQACGLAGDAQDVGVCAGCRRPFCWRHMAKDKDGVWRCQRCMGKGAAGGGLE